MTFITSLSDYADSDGFTLPLRVFQAGFLSLLLRFERFRQRLELAVDVLEQQPLLHDFGHFNL